MSRNYIDQFRQDITPSSFKPFLTPQAGGTMGELGSTPSGGLGIGAGMGLGGAIGGLLGNLFGGGDDGPDPMSFYKQIPQYFQPYMKAGQAELGPLQQEYGQLAAHPAQALAAIGSQYQQSPGLHFAIQQAMRGAGQSAAAGGMAGSPEAQQLAQQKATGLAQQDYYNWLRQATGMMGAGLGGMQQIAGMGQASADDIAHALSQQAQAAQVAQQQSAQQSGGIGGLLGTIAGAAMHFL